MEMRFTLTNSCYLDLHTLSAYKCAVILMLFYGKSNIVGSLLLVDGHLVNGHLVDGHLVDVIKSTGTNSRRSTARRST